MVLGPDLAKRPICHSRASIENGNEASTLRHRLFIQIPPHARVTNRTFGCPATSGRNGEVAARRKSMPALALRGARADRSHPGSERSPGESHLVRAGRLRYVCPRPPALVFDRKTTHTCPKVCARPDGRSNVKPPQPALLHPHLLAEYRGNHRIGSVPQRFRSRSPSAIAITTRISFGRGASATETVIVSKWGKDQGSSL